MANPNHDESGKFSSNGVRGSIERSIQYLNAKKKRDEINEEMAKHKKVLDTFPKGKMGLTPDDVKANPEWVAAKKGYEGAFQKLRNFNSSFVDTFRNEIKSERAERFK